MEVNANDFTVFLYLYKYLYPVLVVNRIALLLIVVCLTAVIVVPGSGIFIICPIVGITQKTLQEIFARLHVRKRKFSIAIGNCFKPVIGIFGMINIPSFSEAFFFLSQRIPGLQIWGYWKQLNLYLVGIDALPHFESPFALRFCKSDSFNYSFTFGKFLFCL